MYRYVHKPWNNDELRRTVSMAADCARFMTPATAQAEAQVKVRLQGVQVLVIDEDPQVHEVLAGDLGGRCRLCEAKSIDGALEMLDRHRIGVVVTDTKVGKESATALVKLLKQHHPDIVTIVLTDQGDAESVVSLINEGQVFRFLQKPVEPRQCERAIDAALRKHAQLCTSPELRRRHAVEEIPAAQSAAPGDEEAGLVGRLFSRIGRLRRGLRAAG